MSADEFFKNTKTFQCSHYRSPHMTELTCHQKRAETKLGFSMWACDVRCKRFSLPVDKEMERAVKKAWEIDDPGFIPIKMSRIKRDSDVRIKYAMGVSIDKIARDCNLSESAILKIACYSY